MDWSKRRRQAIQVAQLLARNPKQARHLPRLSRTIGTPPLETRLPWLAFDVIDWLAAVMTPTTSVFEYGGGGSTAFFADRVARVVTVESDLEWATALGKALESQQNVEVRFASPDDFYREYVSMIDAFPTESFDLVLIDGRERVQCVEHALPRLKDGGWVVLDDSDRERYAPACDLLRDWDCREFHGLSPGKAELGHTTAWRKPNGHS
jgi:predicted O-methyltransferase YrrM